MADSLLTATCNEALSRLFAALGRSLLQYLDEANPWTDAAHAAARATLDRLAERQRTSFTDVADVLARRHVLPESLSFPAEFATLHYLSLGFLADRLIAAQIGVVAAADAAIAACGRDPVTRVLQSVRDREDEILIELRMLPDSLRAIPSR